MPLCALTLFSCNDTQDQYEYALSLDSSIYECSQYDVFSNDGFNVYKNTYRNGELIESSPIDEYAIELKASKEIVTSGYVFTSSGLFAATVSAEGCTSASLTFKVGNSSSLTEKLILNSLPSKTHYALEERFDSNGLSVSLYTEYYDSKSKKVCRTQSLSEYTLYIDGESEETYVYDGYGIKRVEVVYEGYESKVHTYFSTFCLKDSYSPLSIDDRQLMEEEESVLSLSIGNANYGDEGVTLRPEQVDTSYGLHAFSNTNSYIAQRCAPSLGEVPLLVVPVVVPGYEDLATKENYNVIEKAFYGTSDDLNFESLHSYYYKSSYGKLDFRFTLTDYYYLETDSSQFNTLASLTDGDGDDTVYSLSKDCLSWAKETYNLNLQDYDYDDNGAVDGIWMVYMAPYKGRGNVFWAFSGYGDDEPDIGNPVANTYGWISYQFLLGEYAHDEENNPDAGLDAHVLIHETGHMLGLSDYYDTNKTTAESASYDPLGSIDMMSSDIGDMNPYSKLLLGWTSPYVVCGSASIDLKSFQSKDNVVILYDDTKKINDFSKTNGKYRINLFDEYIVLDYYTPYGLNALDYPAYNVESVKESGLRAYHVDGRLTKVTKESGSYSFTILEDPDVVFDDAEADLYRGITNTLNETIDLVGDNGFDEVRWIATNKEKLGYQSDISHRIFGVGDSFSLEEDDVQFINGCFDNGNAFSYSVTVDSKS